MSAFLFPMLPAEIVRVLGALDRHGFLQQSPAAADDQLFGLPAHPVVDALRATSAPSLEELERLLRHAPPGPVGVVVHLYARLTAPVNLLAPLRDDLEQAIGFLAEETDPRAPFDPLEIVLPFSLDDPEGKRRARAFAGWQAMEAGGLPDGVLWLRPSRAASELELANLAEVRVLEETCPYFAFALARSGALDGPVYLVSLDD